MKSEWKINNGNTYAEIEISSWNEFVKNVELNFLDHKEYLYRGHRDSNWKLEPTFNRKYREAIKRLNKIDSKYTKHIDYQKTIQEHLSNFKRNSIGRRINPNKKLDKKEWLALGQHYGLETPLLDWSTSPYIALFFAMENSFPPNSNLRTVWIFSPFALQEIAINQNPESEYIEEIDSPTDENLRLLSQLGKFTLTPENCSIEDFIKKNIKLHGMAPILYRINIKDSFRENFLRHLNSMNISHSTIYPDLIGSASKTNRELEKFLTEKEWQDKDDYKYRLFNLDLTHQ